MLHISEILRRGVCGRRTGALRRAGAGAPAEHGRALLPFLRANELHRELVGGGQCLLRVLRDRCGHLGARANAVGAARLGPPSVRPSTFHFPRVKAVDRVGGVMLGWLASATRATWAW